MKETINFRFNNFKEVNTGAIPTLSKVVRGMHYGNQQVVDAFNKFVPKDEYAKDEKDEILNWLASQNKLTESPEKTLQNKDLENED